MPPEQFGFRKKRSTIDAFILLRDYVKECLNKPRNPVYAVFVDFSKAFDMVPRKKLIRKLSLLHNIRGKILRIVMTILEYNLIKVYDGTSYTDNIHQTRGVQQGDSLSPFLFSLFVADLPDTLKAAAEILQVVMFADDLVFYSVSKDEVQNSLNALSRYCLQNNLQVNLTKTKAMKFRKGGMILKTDDLYFNNKAVEYCDSYEYLGLTVQPQWKFTKHLKRKRAKASAASYSIKNLQKLSLPAAFKFFKIMIAPILTYGITAIWEDLQINHLEILDKSWCDFFKKVLGLPRCCRNRKVIVILNSPTLVESLVLSGRCPITEAYSNYINSLENKLVDIDDEFFKSPAVVQNNWRRSNYPKRHLVCRLSTHGFHHKYCFNAKCKERNNQCICKYCFCTAESLLHCLKCPVLSKLSFEEIDQIDRN